MYVERFANFAQPVLDLPLIRRTRRNHGLEHATITILSQRVSGLRMAGRSTDSGFVLLGEAPTEQIEASVREALRRMRAGEHNLAVHPNCGTNLVTTSLMTTVAAMIGLAGASRRDVWNRLPTVMLLVMVALIFAQPLGLSLQRYITTDGDPADLEVLRITRSEVQNPLGGRMIVHRVVTHSS
ncbi:MAG TPA: DUF6391 domain-containing protein [Phototrophicaceae bacterium]|nr:DUF6391 domain-containing protein [Phototrophicaceae bacterium]